MQAAQIIALLITGIGVWGRRYVLHGAEDVRCVCFSEFAIVRNHLFRLSQF